MIGGLLLCRAEPEAVGPVARLLREPMALAPAGPEWSVLVPEGQPWKDGAEPVDRVMRGWASALAVSAPWPVLALWWDDHHSGYTLASGFRRPVGYVWLASGTPVGEEEAMRTFAGRLGLDPVMDGEALDVLSRPDTDADARARLHGLLAVLDRTGLRLPAGLGPGDPAEQLRAAVDALPEAQEVEWGGWREAVRTELDVVENTRPVRWLRGSRIRALCAAQLAVGLPAALWGVRHRDTGWALAGLVLMAEGVLGLAYEIRKAERTA
ncbi:hypothetical protein ACWCP6_13095 [Streptomyces sp. NPDC002004]